MESPQNVLELIILGVYMTSIDLKDAFYSIPVHGNHKTYMTFLVQECLYVCQMDMDQIWKFL